MTEIEKISEELAEYGVPGRYVTEVIAESVALLESRNSQHGQGNSFQNGNSSPFTDPNPFDLPNDGLPF